jgi:histone-lysine N-methyltransferase SETD3
MKILYSPKHTLLATIVMEERRKPDSYWSPYLDLLPKTFGCFPVFYSAEEKQWLQGSPFLDSIEDKTHEIQIDYEVLCRDISEYS